MFASLFLVLFVAHFAGDYLFQTDAMAKHKAEHSREGWRHNLNHVASHVAASFGALFVAQAALGLRTSAAATIGGIAWIALSHGFIDRRWPVAWWMKRTGSGDFFDHGGAPLVDQAMHIVLGLFPAALLIAALS